MKVIIELDEDDSQEVVELGHQLVEVVGKLEELERRLEILLDAK